MLSDLGNGITNALKGMFDNKDTNKGIDMAIKKIIATLLSSNVSPKIAVQLRKRILERCEEKEISTAVNKEKIVQKIVFEELCRIIDSGKEPFKPKKNEVSTVVFVGLQGSGKTTTCCKYAKYYMQRGFRVGIVCADTFRAGAYEQVKQNVANLNIQVYISNKTVNPVEVAEQGSQQLKSEGCNLILIDTSGRHTQENELFKEMEEIIKASNPTATIFIVDASIGQAAEIHAASFSSRVNLGSVIITKTDGTKNVGGALSSIAQTNTPVIFTGTGEGMSHLELFSPEGFISKVMGMGDISGLIDKLEGLNIEENQEELIGKIKAGEFSMGDFYEQFRKILELGPISQLLSLVPGLNSSMLNEKTFKRMGTIFGGMTKKELRTNGEIFIQSPSRVLRVSRGSGVSPTEVKGAVSSYRMMSQMLKKLTANPMFSGLFGGPQQPVNPATAKAQMDQLKKMMPPGFSSLFDQFDKFL
ncbi:signal recognition particle subunit SRP54 [Nematocida sp. AWRm80]|nr:signal recognition particle subunit SRP54 [Nematocida sp. AWRm80]